MATHSINILAWRIPGSQRVRHDRATFTFTFQISLSLVAQMVKNLRSRQGTQLQFLDWKNPLEEGMTIHSSMPKNAQTTAQLHSSHMLVK